MFLSFNTFDKNNSTMTYYKYPEPTEIESELIDSFFNNKEECIFSFSRFINFDITNHGIALDYFFDKMINSLERTVVDENDESCAVTYAFLNENEIIKNLDQKQIMFLCSIFHALNFKKYLLALVSVLMKTYGMDFEEIKKEC